MKTINQKYHHGDLRNTLIRSGLGLLVSDGISQLSLRKVAKKAGVSEAAPYRHFKNKQCLLAAIAEQGFLQLANRLHKAKQEFNQDVRKLIFKTGHAYINFAQENRQSMRIMFCFREKAEMKDYPSLQEASDEVLVCLVDVVEFCQTEGLTGPGHPLPLALSLWATLHGLSMILLDHCISQEYLLYADALDQLVDTNINVLLQGLKSHSRV